MTEQNRTECCQSLSPMPEADALADDKGSYVGSGSVLVGHRNQQAPSDFRYPIVASTETNSKAGMGVRRWSRRTTMLTALPPTRLPFRDGPPRASVQHFVRALGLVRVEVANYDITNICTFLSLSFNNFLMFGSSYCYSYQSFDVRIELAIVYFPIGLE